MAQDRVKVVSMVKAGKIPGQCVVAPGYKSKYMANIHNSKLMKNKTKTSGRHSLCAKRISNNLERSSVVDQRKHDSVRLNSGFCVTVI